MGQSFFDQSGAFSRVPGFCGIEAGDRFDNMPRNIIDLRIADQAVLAVQPGRK
jgi:hypothetical protein